MKWYKNLYVGESIAKNKRRVIWKIKHNVGVLDIYIISFASNKDNLFDIIPARELLQKGYPKENIKIIGLAKGRDEAFELVQQIIDEIYQCTGDVNVWEYFKEKGKQKR